MGRLDDRHAPLSRQLGVAAALIVIGVVAVLAGVIRPALITYVHETAVRLDIRRFESLLFAVNRLSSERVAVVAALAAESASDADSAVRLAEARRATDATLADIGMTARASGNAGVLSVLDRVRTDLRVVRQAVDGYAALPLSARGKFEIAGAIDAMTWAVDELEPAVVATGSSLVRSTPELAGPVLFTQGTSELREFGGRIATHLVAAILKREPLTTKEIAVIERTRGQLIQLRRLFRSYSDEIVDAAVMADIKAGARRFFVEGLAVIDGLVAEGRTGSAYSLDLDGLTAAYSPTVRPLETMRGRLIGQMVNAAEARRDAAALRLAAAVVGAFLVVVLTLLLLSSLRRSVIRPLLAARETVVALAEDRPPPETRTEGGAAEIRELRSALAILAERLGERRHLTAALRVAAETDPLTGLPNRIRFESFSAAALQTAEPGRFAIVYLDLDDFKTINDAFGHHVGDALLVEAAERLRDCAGPGVFVARLGGDEFAACCQAHDEAALVAGAEQAIAAFSRPFDIAGTRLTVGASLGVALLDAPTTGFAELCQRADIALYQAKAAGRNTWRVFSGDMREALAERAALKADLAVALAQRQFHLLFQPIVDLASGRLAGHEALLRWRHPTRGPVAPDVFVPVLESGGMIGDVGRWVLEEATRTAAGWPEEVEISVNVSPLQLGRAQFALEVAHALMRSGLAAGRLHLEITESSLVGDSAAVLRCLDDLRALGVGVAIDDFGTGYSSIGYMRDRRFDSLKLDRSFVSGIGRNRDSEAILRCVIGLAREMGIRTVGEGVETEEQRDWLRRQGCDGAQGWLFGRPAEAAALAVASSRPRPSLECGT